MATRIDGDAIITGNLRAGTMTIPADSIGETQLDPALRFEHRIPYDQPNTAATTETRVKHTVRGATGEIVGFNAGSIAKAVGDSTVTLDLQKSTGGGAFATVLSAPITLNSASTNFVPQDATLLTSGIEDLVDGDVLRVVVTATIGTGTLPTGVFASISVEEDRA